MQNVSAAGITVVLPGSICGCVLELRAAAGSAFIRLKAGSLRFCELSGAGGEPTRRGAGRVRELQSRTWRAMHDAASVLCVVGAAAPFVKVLVTASAVHAAEGRGRAWWFSGDWSAAPGDIWRLNAGRGRLALMLVWLFAAVRGLV